jgi:rubrerythrin
MINVDRESQASKVTGLMASVPDLIDEMNHNDALANALIRITPDRLMLLKDFSTIIGLIINATYLFFAKRKYHYRELDVSQNVQDTI